MLTMERLREVLRYDEESGDFWWIKPQSNRAPTHKPAGCVKDGYIVIDIDYVRYYAHRLAWFYHYGVWPKDKTDHIDLNRANNRMNNLREATNAQNGSNRGVQKNSKSGIKGVYWYKAGQKWTAFVRLNGKSHYLGYFDDKNEAAKAYAEASARMHGDFGRTA